MKVSISVARLAFPNLFERDSEYNQFSAALILEAGHASIAKLEEAEKQVAKDKWGAKADATLKEIHANGRGLVQDGDKKASYDGYPGNFFVNANNKDAQPTIIDRDRSTLDARSGKPYAGCYVNATVEVWAQDNKWGKRINAQLTGVQFVKDGDSFSAGAPPANPDEFDDLGVDPDADDDLLD